jgi:diguanylate cyclase (GGDEF)-like protein
MTSWVEVELIRRIQERKLKELNIALERKAYEDSLTLIPNRRAAFKHISADLNRISREKSSAVLAIIDIDFFKNVNDTYGHQKGDEVLTKIAQSLANDKRDYDFLARFGGEEFILWLPNTNLDDASIVCERIKDNVQALKVTDKPVTVSFGATCYNTGDLAYMAADTIIDQLISEADQALYQAKNAGRNCIKFHSRT